MKTRTDARHGTRLDIQPADDQVDLAVETLKLVADGVRLRVLWALLAGERSVGDLADTVGAPASTVSRHLGKLRAGRLVSPRRDGTSVYYSLSDDHVAALLREAVYHTGHVGQATGGGQP